MNDGVDADVIDLELDDELFNDSPVVSPATDKKQSAASGTTGGSRVDAVRVSGINIDVVGGGSGEGSRGSTPTEAALAARAKVEEARKAAAALGNGGGSGEVTGHMLDDDDEVEVRVCRAA